MSTQDIHDFEEELKAFLPASLTSRELDDTLLSCYEGELAALAPAPLSERYLTELELQLTATELSAYQPAALQEELLDTLSLAPVEAELKGLTMPSLSEDFLNALTSAVEEVETTEERAVSDKVIPFPEKRKKTSPWKWYSTAAAVAVLGLMAGFKTISPSQVSPSFLAQAPSSTPSHNVLGAFNPQPIAGDLLNVSTNSTVINTLDEGLVPNESKTHYYRAMKIVSMETVVLENENGERVEVKRPVQRTVLVPAVTD